MLTISEIISSRKQSQRKPDASELRRLPYKKAFIYGRLSTPSQVRRSGTSITESPEPSTIECLSRSGYNGRVEAKIP